MVLMSSTRFVLCAAVIALVLQINLQITLCQAHSQQDGDTQVEQPQMEQSMQHLSLRNVITSAPPASHSMSTHISDGQRGHWASVEETQREPSIVQRSAPTATQSPSVQQHQHTQQAQQQQQQQQHHHNPPQIQQQNQQQQPQQQQQHQQHHQQNQQQSQNQAQQMQQSYQPQQQQQQPHQQQQTSQQIISPHSNQPTTPMQIQAHQHTAQPLLPPALLPVGPAPVNAMHQPQSQPQPQVQPQQRSAMNQQQSNQQQIQAQQQGPMPISSPLHPNSQTSTQQNSPAQQQQTQYRPFVQPNYAMMPAPAEKQHVDQQQHTQAPSAHQQQQQQQQQQANIQAQGINPSSSQFGPTNHQMQHASQPQQQQPQQPQFINLNHQPPQLMTPFIHYATNNYQGSQQQQQQTSPPQQTTQNQHSGQSHTNQPQQGQQQVQPPHIVQQHQQQQQQNPLRLVQSQVPSQQAAQQTVQSQQQSSTRADHGHNNPMSPLYLGHNPFIEILRPLSYADDNIVTLNLSHSHIYEIDSDAFVGQRFEHIDLSNNKLGLIHSRSFRIGPSHSRHTPYNPHSNSSKIATNAVYPTRRPPPAHPKSVTIDFSHNPAIVALSGAFDHIDVPNCLLNFTNSTVELKFGAFKKYFKEHPGHLVDVETVDCCEQEWLLGYRHNFVARTRCEHDPNLLLNKVPQQTIIDSCIEYVTRARHSMSIQGPSIIHQFGAASRGPSNSHTDNQHLTYLILGGTAMILTSLSIYIIFYMFSLKAAFVYQMQNKS